MPLHRGHEYLITFGLNYCDILTVYLQSRSDDPIPGGLRSRWLDEMFAYYNLHFPHCRLIHQVDDEIPQLPHEHPNFRNIWINRVNYIATKLEGIKHYDYVFASESYGQWLADGIGAKFVPVDITRSAFNISGTKVRENPYAVWDYLPEPVRAYYNKKVCLFGPESTGKTTLAKALSQVLNTVMVPEYGRVYTEWFGCDVKYDDIGLIIKGHEASTKALLPKANKVLICDTDPIMTAVWCTMLGIERPPQLENYKPCDAYILTHPYNTPWVNDGTRYFPEPQQRSLFYKYCLEELERRRLPFRMVRSDDPTKLIADSLAAIRDLTGIPL